MSSSAHVVNGLSRMSDVPFVILGAACPVDFGKEKSLGIERSQVGPYYNIDPPAIVQSRGFFRDGSNFK